MKSPFKFLDSYNKEDRDIFFGRDQEITDLYRRVFENRMLLVYGVSGTGKSSLINCGLASRFDDSDWLPVYVRRGTNIIDSLTDAFNKQAISGLKKNLSVSEKLQSIYLDHFKPVYLIFDQFEELFIFGSAEEKSGFVRLIKEVVKSSTQCRILFIIREEFLAGITEFEYDLPEIFSNRFRVEKMKRANAISAIEGPCKVHKIETEEGFSEELIDKLCPAGNEIELTFLQIYLDKIFRIAVTEKTEEGKPEFSKELLDKAGNVSDLLGQFLEEQIKEMDDPNAGMSILKSFVSVRGTKRPMTESEILDSIGVFGIKMAEPDILKYLTKFVDLRILRERDETGHFELRHDSLGSKIYEKFSAIEKDIIEVRQFIENAFSVYEKRGKLISADDLKYIAPYEDKLYLNKSFEVFIDKSKNEITRTRRRIRTFAAISTVALIIVLSGFTFWALKERKNAVQKEGIANEEKLKANAARDNAIESDRKANASAKEAIEAMDKAKGSELRIKQEKELAVVKERKTRANNINYLSKEIVTQDPTIALGLAKYAMTLDSDNKAIPDNLMRIYSDNAFYKIFFRSDMGSICQISPDWTKIISANGRTARLTDLTGNNSQLFIGHLISGFPDNRKVHLVSRTGQDDITSVVFSPDGNSVLTGSLDKTAILWDLSGNILQIFKDHTDCIRSVAFSPDGKKILTGSQDFTARLWDLSGKTLQVFRGHKSDLNSVAFSPDGQTILTGSADSTARLWDLSGKPLQIFKGHTGSVSKVAFSPDGKTILTGSYDQTARLWDLSGKTLQILSGHTDYISSLVFSPGGKSILTGSADKTARLWDLQGNPLQIFSGHTDLVNSVAFSPDGNKIVTFSTDGTSRIWNITQIGYKILAGHKDYVKIATFSPDGKTVLTLSPGETARLWDLNGDCLQILRIISSSVTFSPDGKTLLTGFLVAQLMDLQGNFQQTFQGHNKQIFSVVFSPDGQNILTGSLDKTARLWDLHGKTLMTFNGHTETIRSVAFSPDSKTILTGSDDKTARLWDLYGKILQIFSGHNDYVNSVTFSPDGKTILTGSSDKTARLWDLHGNCRQVFSGHIEKVSSVAFSPDGKSILTGSFDKTARLWDLHGNTIQIFSSFKSSIYSVTFSPDGKTILTGSGDNTARLISIKTPLASFFEKNMCEELNVEQKLKYGIIQIHQLDKEKDSRKLIEGLKFCLSEIKEQKDIKTEYLNNAEILYNNLWNSIGNTEDRKSFISLGIDLFRLLPREYILDRIKKTNQFLLSSFTKEKLKDAFDFYSEECTYIDSVKTAMKLSESFIQISDKLLSIDTVARYSVSIDLASLSWQLLQNRKFKTSLDALTIAIKADSMNAYIYTTLPLALVLNNRFDEASRIYLKYYKGYMFDNFYRSNKLIYLDDIADLEKRGIAHPDFSKVKDLLKK
jgi:WD40 repeat protein